LVEQASERLENAQSAYDSFRLTSRYSSPQQAMNSIGDLVPQLESAIRAKQVELNAARRFGTEENIHVQQLEAELQMLKFQLEETKSVVPVGNNSVGIVVHQSTKLDRLKRELNLALILYQNYKRFLEGTSVEDLTDAANVRILEPAYVDAARQVNIIPLALGLLLILSALTLEFYIMRPPLGEDAVA
jgi:capsule polysaccharide export protein KpsE/RkpR